jgi:hypothetical protein
MGNQYDRPTAFLLLSAASRSRYSGLTSVAQYTERGARWTVMLPIPAPQKRAKPIPPVDFLALFVIPPRIANRYFEDPHTALGQLDRQLYLDAEIRTLQGDVSEQRRSHHLVAGLNVREIQVT